MVVWLKPCKSRSSPGALSERLPSRGGVRLCAQRDPQQVIARGFIRTPPQPGRRSPLRAARPATGHRQGLYQNASPAGEAFAFARSATRNRSSPGALSERLPSRGGVRFCAQRDLQRVAAAKHSSGQERPFFCGRADRSDDEGWDSFHIAHDAGPVCIPGEARALNFRPPSNHGPPTHAVLRL